MKNFKYFLFVFAVVSVVCVFASSNALAQSGGGGHTGDDPVCCFNAPSAIPLPGASTGFVNIKYPMTMQGSQPSSSGAQFSMSIEAAIKYEAAVLKPKQRTTQWL
jgi:hypothetical protein